MNPLDGLLVLDFTTLLPGPLATLWMCHAGARVIKVERPPDGDEMRSYQPPFGSSSVNFALLNGGKESIMVDLKTEDGRRRLDPLLRSADVLVEQFRPGVMGRLGLGYERVHTLNPRLVYCSISGYGQTGPKAHIAGHDLNYLAATGMLSLAEPHVPSALVADIGGGSYPAFSNVLLALLLRERTGVGSYLDISMANNLLPWMYWALGSALGIGHWPVSGAELITGGSPRYNLYRASDGRYVATAAIEDRFWIRFCALLGLDATTLDDAREPIGVRDLIASRIGQHTSTHWRQVFDREADVCCNVVNSLQEALADPQFRQHGLFEDVVKCGDRSMPALPSPIVGSLRRHGDQEAPSLDSRSPRLNRK